ncbi:MAG: HipA domain-containing protein [Elusimicrobia bacterium]|nr:HipA domain-containing protein [Elusimicrobiota bacterium]
MRSGARMSISGVQMKLSVRVNPQTAEVEAVAEGGTHILKPEPGAYPEIPRVENLCMNMAQSVGFNVPPHGLLAMSDGTLCYVVKRFDRLDTGDKLASESAFQISGGEDKYKGSLEHVGRVLRSTVTNRGLESVDFFERILLCFLIGNGDMHLKNWGILTDRQGKVGLAPCYDFVSSKLYLKEESDTALTLNGKRDKVTRTDFEKLADSLRIDPKAAAGSFQKMEHAKNTLLSLCASSALSFPLQESLVDVIHSRYARLLAGL